MRRSRCLGRDLHMTLGEYLCALWRSWPSFTTLAGNRAHPIAPPAEEAFSVPALIYTFVGGEAHNTLDDRDTAPSTDLQRTVVQLSAYARTRGEASALSRAAHDALHLAQDNTLRVNLESGPRETKEGDLYRSDRDLAIFHHLAV